MGRRRDTIAVAMAYEDDLRSDEALLAAAAHGDAAAFGALYERHLDDVLRYFYARTRCPHTAADLAAETFAQALAGAGRYDGRRGPVLAWLYGIAGNLHRSWQRRGRVATRHRERMGIVTPHLTDDDVDQIERLVDAEALRVSLAGALDTLSPSLRAAVLLRVRDELPYEAVAERLGCSVDTARVRVSRALAKLERVLVAAP